MGTINYGSNDFFNIGFDLSWLDKFDDYDKETEINTIFDEITEILKGYNFTCFSIKIEPGYYEGFYIDIDFDWLYFDDYTEKRQTQKEITQMKRFLEECCYWGLVQYSPGWCTSYATEEQTKKAIKTAIRETRQKINAIPTYRNRKKVTE